MWKYRIIPSDLGFSIYRKRKLENGLINVEYLNGYGRWVISRGSARTFYNLDDAVSALVIVRKKAGENE